MTWQLRQLHSELDAIDKQRGAEIMPQPTSMASTGRMGGRDRVARRILLDRMLRSLPKRLGFRDARAFQRAFEHANALLAIFTRGRHRLNDTQIRELERRVLNGESPRLIAQEIGCAEQTVLNRASQLRKRLARLTERDGTGI